MILEVYTQIWPSELNEGSIMQILEEEKGKSLLYSANLLSKYYSSLSIYI